MQRGSKVDISTKLARRFQAVRQQFKNVYPSEGDWARLLQSIDEKAEAADATINRVLEQQAHLRL